MNADEIRSFALEHGYQEEEITPEFIELFNEMWDLVQRALRGDPVSYAKVMWLAYGDD